MSFEQGGLSVHDLVKRFGGFTALDHISLEVSPGEALGLVGPNGSGKSTLINVASGVYQHDGGKLFLNGKEMSRILIHERVHLGINRTFQVPKPFGGLSVLDNVQVAASYGGRGQRLPMEVLEQLSLADLAQREASTLNTSQQKLLDLARALATAPQVLLIDEIGAGLNPNELESVAITIRELAQSGIALLVVEHLMGFLKRVTDRVVVMDAGQKIFEGSLEAAAADAQVIEVFLGG